MFEEKRREFLSEDVGLGLRNVIKNGCQEQFQMMNRIGRRKKDGRAIAAKECRRLVGETEDLLRTGRQVESS